MFPHEQSALKRIVEQLRQRLAGRVMAVFAFGSRVRGDHDEWSDFDVLVVVLNKTPSIEAEIISLFVEEEMKTGLSFTPVIKDLEAFEKERRYNTPFFGHLMRQGIPL